MSRASFIRRSLAGTALVAISLLTICGMAATSQRSTDTEISQPTTTTEVTSTECTTTLIATSTTTSSTISSTITAETTTASKIVTTTTTTVWVNTPAIETQPYAETTQPIMVEQQPVEVSGDLPITESERIMLCNLVGREYGSDWVSVYDKACVVATVMNRVNSESFPNTIYDVLVQPNQFTGYIPQDTYTYQVTDSCVEAVDYYFNHQDEFGNYLYFWGDGTRNYFS